MTLIIVSGCHAMLSVTQGCWINCRSFPSHYLYFSAHVPFTCLSFHVSDNIARMCAHTNAATPSKWEIFIEAKHTSIVIRSIVQQQQPHSPKRPIKNSRQTPSIR
uniref:Secreted protein n=1 Tax=Trypanosoma vivax (strain Y486) TaxID=1055687 RepID=G0TXK0_TRYVY|nr:hypothetical protein, unlikely [Trypanosoma vivax Y486]